MTLVWNRLMTAGAALQARSHLDRFRHLLISTIMVGCAFPVVGVTNAIGQNEFALQSNERQMRLFNSDPMDDTSQASGAASETPTSAPGEESTDAPAPEPFSLTTTDRLTGDWDGFRTWMEGRGITTNIGLTVVYQHLAHGGVETKNGGRVPGSYDFDMTFDLEAMKLIKGGQIYALANGSWDTGVTGREKTGDFFGTNYDAVGDRSVDLVQLWYEQALLEKKIRIRGGKINLSYDFDTNAYANDLTGQFLNSALNNNPQIHFPGYVLGHMGAQVFVNPVEWMYYGVGAADAQADFRETGFRTAFHGEDHFFGMQEVGFTPVWNTPLGKLPGNYRFGMWYEPQPKAKYFDDLDGRRRTIPYRRDDVGFYTSLDQLVFKEKPSDDADDQGFGLFFRYGYAKQDVNQIEDFWSIGAQYKGLVPTRDSDVLGFGVAQGLTSEQVRKQDERPGRETVIEFYYRIEIFPWLSLSPDFQMILDPGGTKSGTDAFVAGLRLQMTF